MPSPLPSARPSSTDTDLRRELLRQGRFLDGLVGGLRAVATGLDQRGVLERATREAHALFEADAAVMLAPVPPERLLRPVAAAGVALGPLLETSVDPDGEASLLAASARDRIPAVGHPSPDADDLCRHLQPRGLVAAPLAAGGSLVGVLVLFDLSGERELGAADAGHLAVFADFVAQAAANAALFDRVETLLAQARIREAERAELSRRVVSAEQEERRRLSAFLHDGPVQTLAGVGMMLDAVEEELGSGRVEEALAVLRTARERQRGVIRDVRQLSFVLEPWTLRDQGFEVTLSAVADQFEQGHQVRVELDVADAEQLAEADQVCLFQIVREAMQNALKHAGCATIRVQISGSPQQGLEARVVDDGSGVLLEPDDGLPHHGIASMRERAAILGGRLDIDAVPGTGTTVRVLVGPGKLAERA